MSQLEQYAALRSMLHNMESDLGLSNFTASEKAVLAAAAHLQAELAKDEFVSSRDIKHHDLCAHLPNPTFFRALARLLERQFIYLPAGRSKGLYRLNGL